MHFENNADAALFDHKCVLPLVKRLASACVEIN